MSTLSKHYLFYTFAIMLPCWGLRVALSAVGISLDDNILLYIPYLLGGWSPTIASYLALRKHNEVANLKEWLKNVFDFRHNLSSYVMVFIFGVIYILPQCLIAGYENGVPFIAIIVMIPIMLFGGGLEEAGWRYIFQPELEKKYCYTLSTLIVSIVWWLWHLPLYLPQFFIQGASQVVQNYLAFGINVLGFSFALASIRKNTNSVWLCVLFHCLVNSLSGIYVIKDNILGDIASTVILIFASYLFVKANNKKQIFT